MLINLSSITPLLGEAEVLGEFERDGDLLDPPTKLSKPKNDKTLLDFFIYFFACFVHSFPCLHFLYSEITLLSASDVSTFVSDLLIKFTNVSLNIDSVN